MDDPFLLETIVKMRVDRFRQSVLEREFGNYTKSYEFYRRIRNIERLFIDAVKGQPRCTVLDVGCGDGYHACLFNALPGIRERTRFTAIDVSRTDLWLTRALAASLCFTNIRTLSCSADALAFSSSHFDVVLCSDVIEHLPQPERCLAELRRVLKPGGIAILTTPNGSSYVKSLANALHRNRQPATEEDGGHISVKGVREWVRLAEQAGLRVTAVRRGSLIFGGEPHNRRPILFALLILLDRVFDLLPLTRNWSEAITLKLVKPGTL